LGHGSECGSVGAASKKSRGDLIHPLIGALGRKNRGDEKFERTREVQLTVGFGIGAFENVEDSSGPAKEDR
jgi:hypothetical protein